MRAKFLMGLHSKSIPFVFLGGCLIVASSVLLISKAFEPQVLSGLWSVNWLPVYATGVSGLVFALAAHAWRMKQVERLKQAIGASDALDQRFEQLRQQRLKFRNDDTAMQPDLPSVDELSQRLVAWVENTEDFINDANARAVVQAVLATSVAPSDDQTE